jgi:MFS family permease
VPREMLGRVFGLVSTAPFAGSTIAFAAGGFLLDATSPRAVFVIAGVGVLAVLVPLMLVLRRHAPGDGAA